MAVQLFNDFSGGEFGKMDPARALPNSWTGRNILLTSDGSLCPRPGLKLLGSVPAFGTNGLGYIEADSPRLITHVGTTIRAHTLDTFAETTLNNGAAAPNPKWPERIIDRYAGRGYMFVPNGGKVYRIDLATNAATDTGQSGGVAGSVYGIRLVRSASTGLRVFYSAPDNVLSWPAANFFDMTLSSDIVFMSEQANHLTIVTDEGSWWVLTGVPGINSTLRRITGGRMSPAQVAPAAFVDVGDDLIHYLSPINNFPGSFNGVDHVELPHLSLTPEDPLASYARGTRTAAYNAAVAFQGADNASPAFALRAGAAGANGRMLLMHNGAWSMHDFGIPMSQLWTSDGRGRLFAFNDNAGAVGVGLYQTQLRLDRPAFVSDVTARPGDNSDTPLAANVSLPEVWTEDGTDLRVRRVIIDLTSWNTGSSVANQVDVAVTALGVRGLDDPTGPPRSWTEPGSSASTAGVRRRLVLDFGTMPPGGGYQVRLSNIKGVSIRAIRVVSDELPGRPRR